MTRLQKFPCAPSSVRSARYFVLDTLGDMPDEFRDTVAVMASELAMNAIQCCNQPFEVSVELSEARVRVSVADVSLQEPEMRNPPPDEPHGRGLRIVNELSDEWGVSPEPGGKTVWFSLRIPSAFSNHSRPR